MIPYTPSTLAEKWAAGRALARENFDCAILLQNAFEAAAVAYLAGIPERIGYARDGRSLLLTRAIPVPRKGEIPRHERFYYLELLHRAGILDTLPENDRIRLDGAPEARAAGLARFHELGMGDTIVGMSPGAAYGTAKRWLPERFAEAATSVARELGASVAIFGSKDERDLCAAIAAAIPVPVHNFAGETTLAEYIDLAAACRVYLTNDSGGMHVASALGVPTVAIFGATDDMAPDPPAPGPRGPRTGRVQPLPQTRMPHRPSLHDPRHRRPGGESRPRPAEIEPWTLERRSSMRPGRRIAKPAPPSSAVISTHDRLPRRTLPR